MNETSLSALYRRLTAAGTAPVDAGRLVDAVAGKQADEAIAAGLARSAPMAALARMLGELKADSAELAQAVNPGRRAAHPLPAREIRRHSSAGRRVAAPRRWMGALAACLAIALGVGVWHGRSPSTWSDVDAQAMSAPQARADRIFTTKDRIFASSDTRKRSSDKLFRGDFSGG